jgi:hypothetical protein
MWSKNLGIAGIVCLVFTQLGAWTIDEPEENHQVSKVLGLFASGDGDGTELPFEVYLLNDGDEYDNETGTTDEVDSGWSAGHAPTLDCPTGSAAYTLESGGAVRAAHAVTVVDP